MIIHRLKKLFQIALVPQFLRNLVLYRVAAATEHYALLQTLECDLVVDVGANRGQFAMVARQCFPRARLLAFEPLAAPAQKFQEVFRHDDQTNLYQFAIGSSNSHVEMHVSKRDDSSSLLAISDRQAEIFPGTEEASVIQVTVKQLDEVLNAAAIPAKALLKIDVQGYELEVLRGCVNLLPGFSHIYLEASFIELYRNQPLASEIICFLHSHQFELAGIYNLSANGTTTVQGDLLFRKCTPR